ncbi:F-box protein At2g32560 [Quercus suber]|uniref:F-box protein n=1 Tax=Quercus suber TaxID=58331 RepID=A0AAW0JPR4_QUESU|nr:F-box protein At2g32560-like [Quercus suber]POE64596.1 f-box protein [Quercus suber]
MLYFLISCVSFSFIFLSKSFTHKPLPSWEAEMKLLSPWFWGELSTFIVSWFKKSRPAISFFQVPVLFIPLKNMGHNSKVENVEEKDDVSLLDLPDLALDCILERLSPAGLCTMAAVCSSLRDRCRSDHLWKKHKEHKWDRVISDATYREWKMHVVSRKRPTLLDQSKRKGLFNSLLGDWPSWFRPKLESNSKSRRSLPVDSIKAWYQSLESGKLWFPSQVYNRENGNVGFMLSCYDAELSYDSKKDIFQARYLPHGRRTTEDTIQWERLRAPPVDTPPNVLHVSDCLDDLKPGDHIEIQWRKAREFPYGWWYGIIGHLEACDRNNNHCHCHYSDSVILEFNQYSPDSKWRRMVINRKGHREEGNEVDGFYGGIRKLYDDEEIARWKRLWPTQILD